MQTAEQAKKIAGSSLARALAGGGAAAQRWRTRFTFVKPSSTSIAEVALLTYADDGSPWRLKAHCSVVEVENAGKRAGRSIDRHVVHLDVPKRDHWVVGQRRKPVPQPKNCGPEIRKSTVRFRQACLRIRDTISSENRST